MACYYRQLRHGTITPGTTTSRWKHRLSDIDEKRRTATCSSCGVVKIRKRSKGQWRCGADADERSRLYKEAYRASKKAMLGPACEVCGTAENLCWDHDHQTGTFRGTLCERCNTALGMMDDDPKKLRAAAVYVERTSSGPKTRDRPQPHRRVRSRAALRP